MTTRNRRAIGIGALALAMAVTVTVRAGQATPAVQEHVATLKATLAASQAALRQYEWIETTIVLFKGEEKSRKQHRC